MRYVFKRRLLYHLSLRKCKFSIVLRNSVQKCTGWNVAITHQTSPLEPAAIFSYATTNWKTVRTDLISIESLRTDVFEPLTPTGSQIFFSLDCVIFTFCPSHQLTNVRTRAFHLIRVGKNALKTITVAFRLPSVAQKRLCLSSLNPPTPVPYHI